MFNPVSTCRIQFNKKYTFRDFLNDIDYLSTLGISSIYASPVFEAVPGSVHGYDVTNPLRINPEIGTYEEFIKISDVLKNRNIGWVQDIVPNHMAFHDRNAWLMDVLEKGSRSEYAVFFDIDFSHPDLNGKLMVPFLGKPVKDAIDSHEIVAELLEGKPVFRYFDYIFPFNDESIKELTGKGNTAITPEQIDTINSAEQLLEHLIGLQHYELCYWKESLNRLNYRRFFTINSLICLKMEHDEVFDRYHEFILKNLKDNRFDGLRIDHIDGLQSPSLYLDKIRLSVGKDSYIVIEKILGQGENLTSGLPVQGTSGYDFLGMVNNLFTRQENYHSIYDFYNEIAGSDQDPEELIYNSKKLILAGGMRGEWENLSAIFDSAGFVTYTAGLNRESVKEAIGEFLILFPVYRIYGDSFPLSSGETAIIKEVFSKAGKKRPELANALSVLEDIFLEAWKESDDKREKALNFLMRCMQFTGPLMAKGVEDTVMYTYNCFVCHNEVGDHPGSRGISAGQYHELMIERQKNNPLSMNATSTHDTKRGEDARARLNVISELPGEWIRNVRKWMKINSVFKENINGAPVPDPTEEYFIYQTLAGIFPAEGKTGDELQDRLNLYIEKALREGKKKSDWNDINEEYEKAVKEFTRKILRKGSSFLKNFSPFQKKIAIFGAINSISQLLLKASCPGVPDFYQGTELWDLTLVDPDNRRPVDYSLRKDILSTLQKSLKENPEKLFKDLLNTYEDGRIKLLFTHLLLEERKSNPDLFRYGTYIPLKTEGKYSDHIIAYARVYNNSWFISVVPLFLASIDVRKKDPLEINWRDTSIVLPGFAPVNWTSIFKGSLRVKDRILLSEISKLPLPVYIKGIRDHSSRYAGVLAHISSLPGKYGTGDLGPEAYAFADILRDNGQSYWQTLPFNPVDEGLGWSPYSSVSAFAGNTIFLSPDLLAREDLLHAEILKRTAYKESPEADFRKANDFRNFISDEVFTNFFCRNRPSQHNEFEKFCSQQASWLDDYALFVILKRENDYAQWKDWPKKYRNRTRKAIEEIKEKYAGDLKKEKLLQYLFDKQWIALKSYCNKKGIKLIGDMSFYVNYDSAEVWSHPELFRLDADKTPVSVAGVPPDYFSETGQLWNMPVYDWDRMKKDRYSWWVRRIRRNLELSDVVRFDHFRAFSEFWEVPFGERTAVNGRWSRGPGNDFFDIVKKEYPEMPFIAEDLGSIDDKVYKLRDDFNLPGMTVLQFAFGENTARSGYIPHNFTTNCIVYTGTHDNNTTRGWYLDELKDEYREEASEYAGRKIKDETCHEDFIRMAYGSVARMAIIPVQDLLGLGGEARLNKPSTSENNWTWKMKPGDMEKIFSPKIRRMVELYGRY